ncbi:MAG: AMP-binding protein [Chloroflexi bacterium]|nr:AMP-binding protein [Chloroflexota bacterium]
MVLSKLRILSTSTEPDTDTQRTADGYPLTFRELLEDNRRTWGDKVAFQQKIRGEWRRVSHADVHKRSYDIASGLVALGVEPGDRVALVAENGIEWALSYYAIVVAGAIAVPIYYELKPGEITGMIQRSEAKMLIASAKVLAKLGEIETLKLQGLIIVGEGVEPRHGVPSGLLRRAQPELLSLTDVPGRATPESREQLAARTARPDDLASIVFTSGTTGGSKGVMLTHRNFMANLRGLRLAVPFNDRDRLLLALPLHHTLPFIVGIVAAPNVGGEVTFENDLRRLRDRMAEMKPTVFLGVPALYEIMYRNIVHSIEVQGRMESFERALRIAEATKQRTGINIGRIVFREIHKKLGGSLRFMVSGGAALNPQLGLNFARIGLPVLQGWGLTESSPALTIQRWVPRKFYMSNYYEDHFGAVGAALDGVEIALIDVPEKEIYVHLHGEGELIARGDNITPGYWKAEEETKALKVGGWLRTGDIGRIDDEGNVWITGRSKYVIVLDSGEKVHPDEIEEKIARSPVVEDVVVTGRNVRGKTQVGAVVYPNRDEVLARLAGAAPTAEAVHAIVKDEIDAHEADIAAYKRTTDLMLTDTPLPKTLGLRKIMRGQVAETCGFDPRRWEQSWTELMAAAAGPAEESDEALASA